MSDAMLSETLGPAPTRGAQQRPTMFRLGMRISTLIVTNNIETLPFSSLHHSLCFLDPGTKAINASYYYTQNK